MATIGSASLHSPAQPGAGHIPATRAEPFRLIGPALQLDFLTRHLHANRSHPRTRSEGMLRSKLLFVRLRRSRLRANMPTFPDGDPPSSSPSTDPSHDAAALC